jgi:hypothetical protein
LARFLPVVEQAFLLVCLQERGDCKLWGPECTPCSPSPFRIYASAFGFIWLVAGWGIASVFALDATAADKTPFVNTTFQDILQRVVGRDEGSGAILRVAAKPDSPRHPHSLKFSIERSRDLDEVVITLRWNSKVNDGIYEKYRLRVDDAIRDELAKHDERSSILLAKAEAYQQQQQRKFSSLTGGKLSYLQGQADVRKIFGEPKQIRQYAGARVVIEGSCDSWIYDGFEIQFHDGKAIEIEAPQSD